MIKLSEVKKYSEMPVEVNEPTQNGTTSGDKFCVETIFFDDVMITRHKLNVKLWDIKNLPKINLISSIDVGWTGSGFQKSGTLLYVGQNDGISVFDLFNIEKPVPVRKIALPNYHYFSVFDNIVYAIINKTISIIDEKNNKIIISDWGQINDQTMFSYPIDISKVGNKLYIVFRHGGLYIFEKSHMDGTYELVGHHCPANGYTPTDIHWLIEGEQMLLIGNDNVVQYNVTNPQKLKRYKAAKLKDVEIYGNYVAKGKELLIIGNKGDKNKFAIGVLQLGDNGVEFVSKPAVDYKLRDMRGDHLFGEDARGLALRGDLLLVVGKESGFFLFEARK